VLGGDSKVLGRSWGSPSPVLIKEKRRCKGWKKETRRRRKRGKSLISRRTGGFGRSNNECRAGSSGVIFVARFIKCPVCDSKAEIGFYREDGINWLSWFCTSDGFHWGTYWGGGEEWEE